MLCFSAKKKENTRFWAYESCLLTSLLLIYFEESLLPDHSNVYYPLSNTRKDHYIKNKIKLFFVVFEAKTTNLIFQRIMSDQSKGSEARLVNNFYFYSSTVSPVYFISLLSLVYFIFCFIFTDFRSNWHALRFSKYFLTQNNTNLDFVCWCNCYWWSCEIDAGSAWYGQNFAVAVDGRDSGHERRRDDSQRNTHR